MSGVTHSLHLQDYLPALAPRQRSSHKGCFGHVLIIGGAPGFAGAVRLAGEAALRTGAGCVSIATHPEHAAFMHASRPELMCHGIVHHHMLTPLLEKATVIVIGPGLGTGHFGQALLEATLQVQQTPIVLDADALNLLPQLSYQGLPHHVYTPHPGEAARLLNQPVQTIQTNRVKALKQLTHLYPGIVVLKGHGTLIGQQNHPAFLCEAGNPGLSTAGTGDVLTGIIAGLIAQHIPLLHSVCLGVLLHAHAADHAAMQGERGLLASDLLVPLRALVNPA